MSFGDGAQGAMMAMYLNNDDALDEPTLAHYTRKSPLLPCQRKLRVGDYALVIRSDGAVNNSELTLVQIQNPTESGDANYEQRVDKDLLYCTWKSFDHQYLQVGWFARRELVPVSEEQYEEGSRLISGYDGTENYFWDNQESMHHMERAFRAHTVEMVETEEHATVVRCESCMSVHTRTEEKLSAVTRGSGIWLTNPDTGQVRLRAISTMSKIQTEGWLSCEDCGWSRKLEDNEFFATLRANSADGS